MQTTQSPSNSNERLCGMCHSLSACLRCGQCKGIYYCNATCQQKDWSRHKKLCKESLASINLERLIELYSKCHRNMVGRLVHPSFCDNGAAFPHFPSHRIREVKIEKGGKRVVYVEEVLNDQWREGIFEGFRANGMSSREAWQFLQLGQCNFYGITLAVLIENIHNKGKEVVFRGQRVTSHTFLMVKHRHPEEYIPMEILLRRSSSENYEHKAETVDDHHVVLIFAEKKQWVVDLCPYQYEIGRSWKGERVMPYTIDEVVATKCEETGFVSSLKSPEEFGRLMTPSTVGLVKPLGTPLESIFVGDFKDLLKEARVLAEIVERFYHHRDVDYRDFKPLCL